MTNRGAGSVDGGGVDVVEVIDEVDLTVDLPTPRTRAELKARARRAGGSPAGARADALGRSQRRRAERERLARGPVLVTFAVGLLLAGFALRVLDPPETYTLGLGLPDAARSQALLTPSSGPSSASAGPSTGAGVATTLPPGTTGPAPGTATAGTATAGTATAGTATTAGTSSATSGPSASRRPSTSGSRTTAPAGPVPVVPGASHYVSPAGSDSAAGSSSSPWRTLDKALSALRPGDTLVVGDGTYDEQLDSVKITPGTAGGPIRVRAAPGAHPVVTGLLWFHDADYWDVAGINVRWDSSAGDGDHMVKFSGGRGWTFRDAEISDARAYAAILIADGAQAFRLSGLYVHDTVPTHDTNQDHLIYVNTDAGGGVIERCILAGSPNGRAVKIGPPSGTNDARGNLTIRYNTMYDNGGPSNVQVSQNTSNVKVYRNIMVKPGSGMQNVTALSLSGSGNVVSDNVVFASAGAVEPGFSGLKDGGGNVKLDPQFRNAAGGDFRTGNAKVAGYGRYAG
jgi:hypothetical protein